jgi:hypothetical protein
LVWKLTLLTSMIWCSGKKACLGTRLSMNEDKCKSLCSHVLGKCWMQRNWNHESIAKSTWHDNARFSPLVLQWFYFWLFFSTTTASQHIVTHKKWTRLSSSICVESVPSNIFFLFLPFSFAFNFCWRLLLFSFSISWLFLD